MALDTNTFLIVLAAAIIVMAFVVWAMFKKFRELCPVSQSGADMAIAPRMSAFGGKADMPFCAAKCPLMTQSGHGLLL